MLLHRAPAHSPLLCLRNATYTVGPKAEANEDAVKLIKTARSCLDAAIALCGPGIPYGATGHVILTKGSALSAILSMPGINSRRTWSTANRHGFYSRQ